MIKSHAPRWLVLLIDIYIVSNTFVIAYFIRFNFKLSFDFELLQYQLPFVGFTAFLSFLFIGSYKGVIRHTGYRDALNVFVSCMLLATFLAGVTLVNRSLSFSEYLFIPLSIIVIHFLLNIITLITSRFLFKELYNVLFSTIKQGKRVLIYGAGEAGLITYGVLKEDKQIHVQVVGFIDDDKSKVGKRINGIPVFYGKKISKNFIKNKKIDEVIVAIQKIKASKLIDKVDTLKKFGVEVKIVPPAKKWVRNNLKVQQIKSVKIEDLLGRDPINVNNPILRKEFANKTILITGAAGSIGSEIAKQIAAYNFKQLILIDQAESDLYNLQQYFCLHQIKNINPIVADVRNRARMEIIFEDYSPNFVFHAAAYKHVPLMEEYPYECVNVNIKGTQIITDLAIKHRVEKFIFISTDKAVNPTNVMGASKRIAELYVNCVQKKGNTKFITTRFGNVLGSNGSVIPLFKNQIKNGGPLTVTHKEIMRYFMTISEACQLVLEAGAMGNGGEIFVFDMGESIKIYELALKMIRLSGLKYPKDIGIKITGLRPGEKIYEELLADGENTNPTYHKKIMIAKVKRVDTTLIYQKINDLCSLHYGMDASEIVLKMKEIVPEFKSNNSIFEVLDANRLTQKIN